LKTNIVLLLNATNKRRANRNRPEIVERGMQFLIQKLHAPKIRTDANDHRSNPSVDAIELPPIVAIAAVGP
jgi:hypothetical protein